jgi:hypothetical protein
MGKQSKYTKSARGQACQVRLQGCDSGVENSKVCFAHLNGGGMGLKCADIHGSFCCASCHDILDGRKATEFTPETLELAHLRGCIRTQKKMLKMGVLEL